MDEVEVKYRLSGPAEHERLRAELARLGATRAGAEHEQNRLYADAAGRPESDGGVLRLRIIDGGPAGKLTFKGPSRFDGAIKSRREIEVRVESADRVHDILDALGYRVTLTYDKDRETWRLGNLEIALDELAFGTFCEIEGPAAEIRTLAPRLGLDDTQAEREGYPRLTAQWRVRHEARGTRHE